MKRIICIILASVFLFSAAGCGESTSDSFVKSSSASSPEAFLIDRLGSVPDGVILGDASVAASYGIDMTDFEDEGYVVRTSDDTTLIFGKTDAGLDRAVRAYVKAVESDTVDTLDVVYHEGYRIERLTIAGRDISEYTLYYPETANENMKFAASELVRLVEKATGVKLPVVVGAPVSPAIELSHTDDPALENDGYRYSVTESGLVIEGAVARGCSNGAYRFLQNECGWDQLMTGDSYLNEADHVNISVGTAKQETPVFEFMQIYNPYSSFVSERKSPTAAQNSYGTVSVACHGMQNNKFCEDIDYHSEQICYTSEERYEECFYNVERYIAARYGNPSFQAVDIAQGDNVNFCLCDECMEVFVEEGSTHAGAVVRHANRLSEEMNELYPGIAFQIFAYAGTNKAPAITVPNEYVYVTFCYDMNCSNHKVDGSECEGVIKFNKRNNVMYDEWIKGWCDITPNVWIWFYTLGSTLQQYTVIDNIYADFRYFKEIGARGIFLESENYGDIRIKRVEHILMREMNWNSEMTSEECESVICSILEREYGDGWQYIREYINEWVTAQDLVGCWHCWAGLYADNRYQKGFFKDRFDSFVEMLDEAGRLANTKAQENAVKRLTITMLHMGCYSSYYFAYLEGDTERMELLSDRYDRCLNLLRELGYDPNKFYGLSYGSYKSFASTIEEAAWKEWVNGVIGFTGITGRPLPEDAPVITE